MRNALLIATVALMLSVPAAAQTYVIPLWTVPAQGTGYWTYAYLDPSVTVICTTRCVIAAKSATVPASPISAPSMWVLTAAQPTFTLTCTPAMLFRNGILQNSGVGVVLGGVPSDYTLSGLVATFGAANPLTIPQASDVVIAVYQCPHP
jgi:hypothetical protein